MYLVLFLLVGLAVGAIARFLVPHREEVGWLASMLVGVAGSFLGGLIGGALSLYRAGEPGGFVWALLGAVLLLAGYHKVVRRLSAA